MVLLHSAQISAPALVPFRLAGRTARPARLHVTATYSLCRMAGTLPLVWGFGQLGLHLPHTTIALHGARVWYRYSIHFRWCNHCGNATLGLATPPQHCAPLAITPLRVVVHKNSSPGCCAFFDRHQRAPRTEVSVRSGYTPMYASDFEL